MKRFFAVLVLIAALCALQGCGQVTESSRDTLDISGIYVRKAQEYIDAGDYAAARTILEEGLETTESKEMKQLLDAVEVLQSAEAASSASTATGETASAATTAEEAAPEKTPAPTATPEPTPEPTEAPRGPSEADIQGIDEKIVRPSPYAWLNDYEVRYVHSSRGGGIYLRYAPSQSADRISTLSDDTMVTVLAEQDGFSFVSAPGRAFGWCKANLLEAEPYTSGLSGAGSGTYNSIDFLGTWDAGMYSLELTRKDSYRDGYYDATITAYPDGDTRVRWTYFALYDPHREGFECYRGTKEIAAYPYTNPDVRYSGTGWAFISIMDTSNIVWSVTTGETGDPENIVFGKW